MNHRQVRWRRHQFEFARRGRGSGPVVGVQLRDFAQHGQVPLCGPGVELII